MIEDHVSAGDRGTAFTLALRWVDLDPLEDEAQHTLIQLLAERGNRSAALERFEVYRERLAAELEVEPLERTLELVRKIRAGEIAPPEPAVGRSTAASGTSGASTTQREHAYPLGEKPASLSERLEEEFAGRLEIRGTLSEGSVATVFLAREPELNRLVAVKVFAPRLISDRRARARFEREARAIAALRHRNIVTLYWAETLSNRLPFIVMEYVKGRTLADRLKALGRLSVAEARRVIISLAGALEEAHRQGIIHRDVNPENLLYEEEESRYLLSDFGFASMSLRDVNEPPSRLTESGEMIGQPGYRSPEQLMEKDLTELSDIYGVGLVAYEILTGKPPYDVATGRGRLKARLGMSPAPSELRDDVDERWDDLIERCMAVEPTHRPSAADVVKSARGLDESVRGKKVFFKAREGLLSKLLERRVPHFVAAYLASGFAVLELLGKLMRNASIPEVIYPLGLATYVLWFPAVLVGAWFHGRKGAQEISRREWLLYGGVALLWLIVCIAILLAA